MLTQDQEHNLMTVLYPALFSLPPNGLAPHVLDQLFAKATDAELDAIEDALEVSLADASFDFRSAAPGTPCSSDDLRGYATKALAQIRQRRSSS